MIKKLKYLWNNRERQKKFYNEYELENFLNEFRGQININWALEHEKAHYDKARELGYNPHYCIVYKLINEKKILIGIKTEYITFRQNLQHELEITCASKELSEEDIEKRDCLLRILGKMDSDSSIKTIHKLK